MAMTYTQLQDLTSRVVKDMANIQARIDTAKGEFESIETKLTAMQTTYADWATDIEALATANPNDDAAKALKSEKDFIVAEFSSTKTRATTFKNAIEGAE